MACLGAKLYDPTTAVAKTCASLIGMTAIDTTNLRIVFTVPRNGTVLVRLKGVMHGSATGISQILLGVLEGSTVRGRQAPISGKNAGGVATGHMALEAVFLVTGLTAGASLTWDAAYGVEFVVASSDLKYGGPDNATTNDAFGGFSFEVWETDNLLAGVNYDPGTAVSKSTATLIAMTAFDTTNLRHTFNVPASGQVYVRLRCASDGGTVLPQLFLGVLESTTIRGRVVPQGGTVDNVNALATSRMVWQSEFVVSGLTAGASLTWDAAYSVDIVGTANNISYGGPNDTTASNAWGGFVYEIWSA